MFLLLGVVVTKVAGASSEAEGVVVGGAEIGEAVLVLSMACSVSEGFAIGSCLMHVLQSPVLQRRLGWKHLQRVEWFATSVLHVLFSLSTKLHENGVLLLWLAL